MRKFLLLTLSCVAMAPVAVAAEPAAGQIEPGNAASHMVKAPKIDFEHLRDPFQSYLDLVQQRLAEKRASLVASDHPKEPLEAFDLSALKLVAIFKMGAKKVAMVQDTTGTGYIVRPGSYIGLHGGRVARIEKDAIVIVEKALSPSGEIVEREVRMTLKEVNEPNG